MDRLIAFTVLVCFGVGMSYAARFGTRSQAGRPQAELAMTMRAVSERGFHAKLPPHISTLLGLTRKESCAVMQGVLRSPGKVEGIDVSEKNHNDVVIFTCCGGCCW